MISVVVAAALWSAAPVSSITAQNAPSGPAGKPNAQGLVCRKEAILGSRLKSRVCLRPDEWEERKNEDRDLLDKAQRQQTIK